MHSAVIRSNTVLLVKGNKLFLYSLLGFNAYKHIILNIPFQLKFGYCRWRKSVITSLTQNGRFHDLLRFLLPEEFHVYIMRTCLSKYIAKINSKNWKFSDKKRLYFSYFCSKHRLWVGGSNEYPQSMILSHTTTSL